MKENETKNVRWLHSAVPIYIAAGAFLLYGLLFPLYRMKHIITALIVTGIVYLIAKAFFPAKAEAIPEKPPEPVKTGDEEVDELLKNGRESMVKLRNLNDDIRDEYLTLEISRMEKAGKLIFDTIQAHPERAGKIRRFMSYYLPTSLKLLESYKTLSAHSYQGENVRNTLESIKSSMDMIATAFEKQADSLFDDENMDITTDIEVLESVLKSEGLKEETK